MNTKRIKLSKKVTFNDNVQIKYFVVDTYYIIKIDTSTEILDSFIDLILKELIEIKELDLKNIKFIETKTICGDEFKYYELIFHCFKDQNYTVLEGKEIQILNNKQIIKLNISSIEMTY